MINEKDKFSLQEIRFSSNNYKQQKRNNKTINRLPMVSSPIDETDGRSTHNIPPRLAEAGNCDLSPAPPSTQIITAEGSKTEECLIIEKNRQNVRHGSDQHDHNSNSYNYVKPMLTKMVTSTESNHEVGRRCRVRYFVALLGLTIAVVNCYAQATFCLSIVEMVLPPDYVFKPDNGQAVAVKVSITTTTNETNSPQQQQQQASNIPQSIPTITTTTIGADNSFDDNSCPVEYRYRYYYDSWRFPSTTKATNSTEDLLDTSNQLQQQPTSPSQSTNNLIDISNRFDWDASRQGLLLGAFAAGTAPLQVLGGRLAEIYGAKWVLLIGCIGTALTNLTIPFLAHFSFTLLTVNRVIMGIAQAGMEPGLMCLLAEWLTPAETGFFISMLLFAICIGFFLGSLCSSFLLGLGYGWALTYYFAAGMNMFVALIWFFYSSSRPSESKLISVEELNYIEHEQRVLTDKGAGDHDDSPESNSNRSSSEQEAQYNDTHKDLSGSSSSSKVDWRRSISPSLTTKVGQDGIKQQELGEFNINMMKEGNDNADNGVYYHPISSTTNTDKISARGKTSGQAPWKNILCTPSVWAFMICKISIRWCADVLSIELPTYLANVLHLSIKLNGTLNSVSSALFAIFSFITGYLVNEILVKQQQQSTTTMETNKGFRISKTNLRKIFQSMASFGSAITLFLMTRYDCNILFSMSMLLILSCTLVMGTGGELQIPYDMTSRYPGTLHGMACTLSVSGWLAPPLIGLILGDQPSSRYRWSIVWYLTALINLVGGLVFVLFADARPRDFDQPGSFRTKSKQYKGAPGGIRVASTITNTTTRNFANTAGLTSTSTITAMTNDFETEDGDENRSSSVGENEASGEEIQARDRGRHSASYYNEACKSSDSSPVSQTRQSHQSGLKLDRGNQEKQPIREEVSQSKVDLTATTLLPESCLYFDRELLRIRQVEGSLIEPRYLQSYHDSVAGSAAAIMFPYQAAKEHQNKGRPTVAAYRHQLAATAAASGSSSLLSSGREAITALAGEPRLAHKVGPRHQKRQLQNEQLYYLDSEDSRAGYNNDEEQQSRLNTIWRLWTRARRRRKKFIVEAGERERTALKKSCCQQQQPTHLEPGSLCSAAAHVLPHNGQDDHDGDDDGRCNSGGDITKRIASSLSSGRVSNNQQLVLEGAPSTTTAMNRPLSSTTTTTASRTTLPMATRTITHL